MIAFVGQADVLKGADALGAVTIFEVTADWSAGSSVISCSIWFQVVTKRQTGTIFWKMSSSLTIEQGYRFELSLSRLPSTKAPSQRSGCR